MRKTLRSAEYTRVLGLLADARHKAGLTQHDVAARLEKPQSFIAKYENGERRLDVVEFVTIARALDADPLKLFKGLLATTQAGSGKPDPRKRRAGK